MASYPIKQVYTAGPPPKLAEMFVGRAKDVEKAVDLLANTDKHLLVTGQRGIGKTSFCQHIKADAPDLLGPEWHTHRLVVHPRATAASFLGDLISAIGLRTTSHEQKTATKGEANAGVDFKFFKAGGSSGIGREHVDRFIEIDPFSPNQILDRVQGCHLVIIDEFDLLAKSAEGGDIAFGLMELAKAAGDVNTDQTQLRFIFAGLTHRAAELMSRHDSIGRYVNGIPLRRFRRLDCHNFFDTGERLSGINFHPVIRDTIISDSNGYPYFLQEVASHCCRIAQHAGCQTVELAHYSAALEEARESVERAQNVRFYEGYARLRPPEKALLEQIALSKQGEVAIPKLLQDVSVAGRWPTDIVSKALNVLVASDIFLYRARDRERVGFVEPFFQGYLERRLRGPVQSKKTSNVIAKPIEQMKLALPPPKRRSSPE